MTGGRLSSHPLLAYFDAPRSFRDLLPEIMCAFVDWQWPGEVDSLSEQPLTDDPAARPEDQAYRRLRQGFDALGSPVQLVWSLSELERLPSLFFTYTKPLEQDLSESGLTRESFLDAHQAFLHRFLSCLVTRCGARLAHLNWSEVRYDRLTEAIDPYRQAERIETLLAQRREPLAELLDRKEPELFWMLALPLPRFGPAFEQQRHRLAREFGLRPCIIREDHVLLAVNR
ncbi:MAG: hypothetical protein ACAI44_20310 [Candidatus Sericytochromatia bacterium]